MPEKSLLPFALLGAGFLWSAICEWLRHKSARKHVADGSVPTSDYLTLVGIAGLLIFMVAAAIAAYVKWFP
jgi:hypothetical protein